MLSTCHYHVKTRPWVDVKTDKNHYITRCIKEIMNYKPRKKLMKYKETNKAALKIDYANLSILKSF
jgi:hypothetical protein